MGFSKMKSLKIAIHFTSPVASLMQSDTIFGQFAWWYRYKYGEERLTDALKGFETQPFAVFSDGFLENTISMPILKPQSLSKIKDNLGEKYYEKMKEVKSARYINLDDKWLNGENINFFSIYHFMNCKSEKKIKRQKFIRNSINRISDTTEEGLYSIEETFFNSSVNVDIYAKYDENKISENEIEEIFDEIGSFGFGKDKSTGKGRFRIVKIEENPKILDAKQTNAFVSLSSGIFDENCSILFGKKFTKFGKHSEELVFKNPFKNPVILFKAGSVFKIKQVKDIYGRGLELSNFKGHYQNAFMIPLFVNVEV